MKRLLAMGLLLALAADTTWAGTAAPAFTLPLLQGGSVFDSKAQRGKRVVVVRFQASW